MYKAVLVDDETYDLEGMRKLIPWQDLNIEIVCCENKPLAAMDYMAQNEVDLLITDIKMPVLNGLELAKKALERNPDLRTVFISGYEDFQYAKQALQLKADGYVLKPVDDQEIIDLLQRMTAEMEDNRSEAAKLDYIQSDFFAQLLEASVDTGEILERLFSSMSNYRLVQIYDCIEELFRAVRAFEHPVKVVHFSVHVLTQLEAYLQTLNESLSSLLGPDVDCFAAVRRFNTIDDIEKWLRRTAFELSELLYLKRYKRNRKLIEGIEAFVQARLNDEITLKEAAHHFSYSPNHLGHVFKEQMGENFGDYVTKKRMKIAKELLLDPKLKIYEVADRVGYKSLTHFGRIFKEHFGITPGDYRKRS